MVPKSSRKVTESNFYDVWAPHISVQVLFKIPSEIRIISKMLTFGLRVKISPKNTIYPQTDKFGNFSGTIGHYFLIRILDDSSHLIVTLTCPLRFLMTKEIFIKNIIFGYEV